MISKGFEISTFAASVGSRHPFLSSTEVENYEKRLVSRGATQSLIDSRLNPVLFDEDEFLGSEVRSASINTSNGSHLIASTIREVFDRKAESKMLRFFMSGNDGMKKNINAWVCVPKDDFVPDNVLFYGQSCELKERLEAILMENCILLTIGQ